MVRYTTTAFALAFLLGLVPYAQADDDARQCSTATLRGSFGFTGTGFIVSGASVVPFAAVGTLTFDGQGNYTFSQVASRNGDIFSAGPIDGTYTLNADCTGTLSVANVYFVVDDNGKELRTILQVAGTVITNTARKIRSAED